MPHPPPPGVSTRRRSPGSRSRFAIAGSSSPFRKVRPGSASAPSFAPRGKDPESIARDALAEARRVNADVVLLDTAGRLQVDQALLEELKQITQAVPSQHRLLVLDAMTGQAEGQG